VLISTGFQIVDTSNIFIRPRIEEYYIDNMNRFHASRVRKCQEQAIDIARLQVDSVLTGKKFKVAVDSFLLYPKAIKPDIPDLNYDLDSIELNPLFEQDSI
jgi:hypothetical protein